MIKNDLSGPTFFYEDVEPESVKKMLVRLSKQDREVQRSSSGEELCLRINSLGGDLAAGLAGFDGLRKLKSALTTEIEGFCCSAAALIFLSGDFRIIGKNSFIMIHDISATLWGTPAQLQQNLELAKRYSNTQKSILKECTGLGNKEIEDLCKRDSWLDARQALELGLADGIR